MRPHLIVLALLGRQDIEWFNVKERLAAVILTQPGFLLGSDVKLPVVTR